MPDPVRVESIDYQVSKNAFEHQTNEYDITHPGQDRIPQLVVRRGQPFEVQLKLDRAFDKENDNIKVIMEIGYYLSYSCIEVFFDAAK